MRWQHFGCDAERDWAKRSKSRLNWFAIINKSKHFEQVMAEWLDLISLSQKSWLAHHFLFSGSLSILCNIVLFLIIFEAENHRKRHFHHKHCSDNEFFCIVAVCICGHCSEKRPEHCYRKLITLFSIWAVMIVGFTGLLVKCGMRKFAYVGDRLSIVNSGKWACYTVVVRTNLIKFE